MRRVQTSSRETASGTLSNRMKGKLNRSRKSNNLERSLSNRYHNRLFAQIQTMSQRTPRANGNRLSLRGKGASSFRCGHQIHPGAGPETAGDTEGDTVSPGNSGPLCQF